MVTPHLGFGLEVDLHYCVDIGRLNPVLKHAVDKNCFFAFDAYNARGDTYLMTCRSDELRMFNTSSD
jgi:hypothetical protein